MLYNASILCYFNRFHELAGKVGNLQTDQDIAINLGSQRLGKDVIKFKDANLTLGDHRILNDFNWLVQAGERTLQNLTPDYITIDVAHGHSDRVIKMIKYIKQNIPNSFLIAGNVGTPEAVRELENAGADATKVGIGPGKVCITKLKTGFGTGGWQLAAIRLCAKAASKPIIADGGVRNDGDITKSIRFGASMVMIGSLLAGHEESPGKVIEKDGQKYKAYFGSASQYQKGEYKNVEGKRMLVPYKGKIMDTLTEMQQDLQSSISYGGGKDLLSLRKVDYVIVKNSIYNGDVY